MQGKKLWKQREGGVSARWGRGAGGRGAAGRRTRQNRCGQNADGEGWERQGGAQNMFPLNGSVFWGGGEVGSIVWKRVGGRGRAAGGERKEKREAGGTPPCRLAATSPLKEGGEKADGDDWRDEGTGGTGGTGGRKAAGGRQDGDGGKEGGETEENSRRGRGGRREEVGEKAKGRGQSPRAPEEEGGTETARQNNDRGKARGWAGG